MIALSVLRSVDGIEGVCEFGYGESHIFILGCLGGGAASDGVVRRALEQVMFEWP